MSLEMALIKTDLPGLSLLSAGKVRDVYSTSDPDALLFVATDRISAFDVVLQDVSPTALYFIVRVL
jgi:phosphoribosylaminoimidazole-succinocarboxamide synthase